MRIYTTVKQKNEIADDTYEFYFEKPEQFQFEAGQFVALDIPSKDNPEEKLSHHFSVASSPLDNYVCIASRIRESEYKQSLISLSLGDEVEIDGPMGVVTMPSERTTPLVFLAGGIGVAPFYSMLKYVINTSDSRMITLLHSNTSPKNSPYIVQLSEMEKMLNSFKYIPTMTDEEFEEDWSGQRGIITEDLIKQNADHWEMAKFYIVGPGSFADAMEDLLINKLSISVENIKKETFTGY